MIDLATAPETAALRVLSRASGGTVLGFEQQIEPALAALSTRWRLWIGDPDEPVDGRLHTVAVRLPDQMQVVAFFFPIAINLPGGARRTARPQAWLRFSTPQEIAEARLEGLLSGRDVPGGDLPLTAGLHRTASGLEIRIDVAPVQNPARPGPVRISWGCSDGGVRHQIVPVESLEKGFLQTIWIEPCRRIAVVVEALGPERWAGKVLEIDL